MISNLRQYDVGIPVERPTKAPYVHAPVEWIAESNRCPEHCASKVAILIWFLHSVTKQNSFKVSNTDAMKFALDRKQKAAGLKALERAGLISIQPRSGKSPLVTLAWTPGRRSAGQEANHLPPAESIL